MLATRCRRPLDATIHRSLDTASHYRVSNSGWREGMLGYRCFRMEGDDIEVVAMLKKRRLLLRRHGEARWSGGESYGDAITGRSAA
ncbi:hypothetical protein [Oryza sativa Japonica Group]|uniref:Uncharacterized protein n=1 Tax=Oryza sativa subsp. japonica TaxID=39947 RepID=Q5N7D8_ORYSJ|nr:hypothetical protein [Oryza sativa Japonica Group]BAD82618.1 hypothetical protein [Oryza sativa Japonica Group]